MNSLAYLSRQFDVLASAKTPPSTPTSDRSSFIRSPRGKGKGLDSSLQRVSTWSTKSFLFPPSPSATGTAPKRSSSSPSFASPRRLGAAQASLPFSPGHETQSISQPHVENAIRRIFFLRVFVLVWDNLRVAWLSLWRTVGLAGESTALDIGNSDIEIEKSDNKENVDDIQSSTIPITSSSQNSTLLEGRSDTDPTNGKLESQPSGPPLPNQTVLLRSESPASTSRSPTPILAARKTPFHLPKTLVLDLDETLIHSTSRPIYSSVSGGSGLLGLSLDNSRNKGTSHMVEVVLGGRSTLYHVYKRPFVDFFLRTVCPNRVNLVSANASNSGFGMVHTRYIHCLYARVRRPGYRLARRWTWHSRTPTFPRCM